MTIKFNALTEKEYYTLRQEILSAIEGRRNEVYRDSEGIATIGIGLNLRDSGNAKSVLEANMTRHKGIETKLESKDDITTFVNASSGTFRNDAEAKRAVNEAWKAFAEGNSIVSDTLSLTDKEMETLFNAAAETREITLSQHFAGNNKNSAGETVQAAFTEGSYSYERLAIFSLVYNAGGSLLGNNLTAAINDGDRFKAWFEIRHASNAEREPGLAKRRYYEAELFGLFDNRGNPTSEEIRHIIETLPQKVRGSNSTYISRISNYEKTYEYVIKDAYDSYANAPFATNPLYIGEVFRPLAKELLAQFLPADLSEAIKTDIASTAKNIDGQVIPGITNADGHIAPRGYSSDPAPKPGTTAAPKTNLLVALEQEGTDANGNVIRKGATFTGNKDRDIMLGGDGENTMNGDKGNDIMVGGNKKDTMNGGDDNDILIGRDGNDELNGGNGNDTLFGGKGKDTLKGGTGEDTYVFAFEDIDGDVISDPDGGGKIKIDQRLLGNLGKIEYGGGATWTEKRGDYSLTYKLLNHKPAKNGNSDTSVGDLQITVTQGGESKSFTIKDWTFRKSVSAAYGADPDDSTQTVLQGSNFNFTFELPSPGNAGNHMNGDQRAPYKRDGKTFDWDKTQWDYETGELRNGIAEENFNDAIHGSAQRDIIRGFGGNDALDGKDGNDRIEGGNGHDLIAGGKGSDWIDGGDGDDHIFASRALAERTKRVRADEVPVLKGSNVGELLVDGSAWGLFADASGNFDLGTLTGVSFTPDVADASNTKGDIVFGGKGRDDIYGSQENDVLVGDEDFTDDGAAANTEHSDTIFGMGGNDAIYGGSGNDILQGDSKGLKGSIGYLPPEIPHGNDVIHGGSGNDGIVGNGGDDHLYGDSGDDLLVGDDSESEDDDGPTTGNDVLHGGTGNDVLFGGPGDDELHGDEGDDKLIGGSGNDVLTGGTGNDIFYVRKSGLDHKIITDFGNGNDHIVLRGATLDGYHLIQVDNDLILSLKDGQGDITIMNFFTLAADNAGIIHGQDGKTHSVQDIHHLLPQPADPQPPADESPVTPPADETPVTPPADETPVTPPANETPVAPPADETPVAPPADETPVSPPADETPVTPPADETPVAPPADETPVTPPADETPVTPPADETPVAPPADETPVAPPADEAPVAPPEAQNPYQALLDELGSFLDLDLDKINIGRTGNDLNIGTGKQDFTLPGVFDNDVLDEWLGAGDGFNLGERQRENQELLKELWGDDALPPSYSNNHQHGGALHERLHDLHDELHGLI